MRQATLQNLFDRRQPPHPASRAAATPPTEQFLYAKSLLDSSNARKKPMRSLIDKLADIPQSKDMQQSIEEDTTNVMKNEFIKQSQNKHFTSCDSSISQASTNASRNFELTNFNTDSLSTTSYLSSSNITSIPNLHSKPPLDFKQFLDESQKLKLKREEEVKAAAKETSILNDKLRNNLDSLKNAAGLSSSSIDLISQILNKQSHPDTSQHLPTKINSIQNRLAGSLQLQKLQKQSSNEAVTKQLVQLNDKQVSLVEELVNVTKSETLAASNSAKFDELLQKSEAQGELVAKVLKQPSIKQKYEELISGDTIELTLPYRYKLLLRGFEKLEDCIGFFKDRNKVTLFNDLKTNLEQQMRMTISLRQLQQILTLYPQAYALKWLRCQETHKWDILLQPAQDQNSLVETAAAIKTKDTRIAKLKDKLIERVRSYHRLYLKARGALSSEEELATSKVWHRDFDVQSVPEIEEAALPLKPNEHRADTINAGSAATVKNDVLAKLMMSKAQATEEKERQKKELIERSLYISTTENKSGLSERLYQLIKAKEQRLAEEKLKISIGQQGQKEKIGGGSELEQLMRNRIPEVKKVVEVIAIYFMQRKVSNMFHVSLIDHVLTNTAALFLTKTDVIQIIDFLLEQCPFWITSIPNKQGTIIRVDKSVSIQKIITTFDH